MNALIMLTTVSLTIGAALALVCVAAYFKLSRLGKAFIILVDGDGRSVRHGYYRPKNGEVHIGNERFLLDGLAKHGGKYSTWILDVTSGWNYRAPTRAEKYEKKPLPENPDGTITLVPQLAVLEPSNPRSYHKAIRRHRWNDLLQAGDDSNKNAWIVPALLIALVAVIVIVGAMYAIMSKIGPAASG